MSFILDNFWKILFGAILIVGGWYWWNRGEDTKAWEKAGQSLSVYLKKADTGYQAKEEEVQANFWKCLGRVKEIQTALKAGRLEARKPKDLEETESQNESEWALNLAFEKQGMERHDPEVKVWRASILDNLRACEEMKIFSDSANLKAMLEGRAPTVTEGQFAKDKLVIVNKIPAFLAREAVNHPANFVLMPATAAALYVPEVDDKVNDDARTLANSRVITMRSLELIKKQYEDGRK